jgi:hypothetical protein
MLWPDLLRSNGGAMTIAPQIDAGLQAQLELARQVQLRLLPERRCCLSDWDVAFSCESAGFVSGDYVDFESWDEFSTPDSSSLDFVFTVCDNAANEACPLWPGQPMTAHWGIPYPAAVQGTPEEIEHAFSQAFTMLDRRISLFLCLPLATLDTFSLQKEIDNIGKR